MSTSKYDLYLSVTFTLKAYSDGTTQYIGALNRPWFSTSTITGSYPVLPILLNVSSIGTQLDESIPSTQTATFTLDDSIGSFGADRKFSDLLQRYCIIGQAVDFAIYRQDRLKAYSSYDYRWVGRVLSWDRTEGDPSTITITCESRTFERRPMVFEMNSTDITTYNTPTEAITRTLPLVIGTNIQVKPVLGSDENSYDLTYFYATNFGNNFQNGGITAYYVRNEAGDYVLASSDATIGAAKFTDGTLQNAEGVHQVTGESIFVPITLSFTFPYLLYKIRMRWYAVGGPFTDEPTFNYTIWSTDSVTGAPLKDLGKATDKKASASYNGSTESTAIFERPILLENANYYIECSVAEQGTAPTYWALEKASTGATDVTYLVGSDKSYETQAYYKSYWALWCVQLDDYPTASTVKNSHGLGFSLFTVLAESGCDLSQLDWIVEVNGIQDDVGGTITGTPASVITRPDQVLKLAALTWSGSAWSVDSTYWDFSTYSSYAASYSANGFSRSVGGATEGLVYVEDFVRAICENSLTKIALLSTGKLAPQAYYGLSSSITGYGVARLGPDDCRIENIRASDPSYVVNDVKFGVKKGYLYFDAFKAAIDGTPGDYEISISLNESDGRTNLICGYSRTFYGRRSFASNQMPWLRDETSGQNVAYGILTQHAHPPIYCDVVLPGTSTGYEILQTITVFHPSLMSFFGSSFNARLPHYSGTPDTDIVAGYDYVIAESYTMVIEGRMLDVSFGKQPELRLTCRVVFPVPAIS